MEAQWQPLDIPEAGIRFLASGHAVLSGKAVEDTLSNFVNAVIARLDDMGLPQTTLHEQWLEIQQADPDEKAFCNASARLGLDPYAIDHELDSEILTVSSQIRPELLDDFLSLANVDQLAAQTSALAAASQSIQSDDDEIDALKELRSRAPSFMAGQNPWDSGYPFAEALRAKLNG